MCFSATASFGSGVILSIIGFVSLKKIQHKSELMFASIPLIFGLQQIAEGILWISLPNPDLLNMQIITSYIFLIVAQVIWPIWIPVSILLLEQRSKRNNIQKYFVGFGILVASYLAYSLLTYTVEAKIIGHHIAYIQGYPDTFRNYVVVLYALSAVASPFFSHIKRVWILGVIFSVSFIITAIFYKYAILSVWCFFSTIISIFVYFIISENSKFEKQKSSACLINQY